MSFFILGLVLLVQCSMGGVRCEVNNIVKSKILFSNQDLIELNSEVKHATREKILSREQIFKFLKQQVPASDVPKLVELLNFISEKELRHIDFLIYLTTQYKTAASLLLQSIFEMLNEDETNFALLMKNFG